MSSAEWNCYGQEIIVDFGASYGIHTVLLIGDDWDTYYQANTYGSNIHVCDDPALDDTLFPECGVAQSTVPVSGTGYFPFSSVKTGRYLSVRRPTCSGNSASCLTCFDSYSFYLGQIMPYQVPNIIQQFGSVIAQAPDAYDPNHTA